MQSKNPAVPIVASVVLRFAAHLALSVPVFLLGVIMLLMSPAVPHNIHPFQDGGGHHDPVFAPTFLRTQFDYYAALPCWLVFGVLSGMLFSAGRTGQAQRQAGVALFGLWLVALTLSPVHVPFLGAQPEPAFAACGFTAALAVCRWRR